MPDTLDLTAQQRRSILEDLYKSNYGALHSMLYDLEPNMLFSDAEKILRLLANNLPKYRGKPEQDSFYDWASRFVKKKARQFSAYSEIAKAYSSTIFYAIRDGMSCFAKDSAIDYDDLRQEVHLLILRYALNLQKPGTASLTNRLNKLISNHCWRYHIRKRKRRLEIVTRYRTSLNQRGMSVMTPAEIASERWDDDDVDYCAAPVAA